MFCYHVKYVITHSLHAENLSLRNSLVTGCNHLWRHKFPLDTWKLVLFYFFRIPTLEKVILRLGNNNKNDYEWSGDSCHQWCQREREILIHKNTYPIFYHRHIYRIFASKTHKIFLWILFSISSVVIKKRKGWW